MPGFQSALPVVWQAKDATRINEILNHAKVRPWIADAELGVIDFTQAINHPNVFVVLGEHGGFVVTRLLPGVFEVHTHVLPEGRGEWTDGFIQAGIRWLFSHTEAYEIVTRVPERHLPAKATTLRSGMTYEFTPDHDYVFRGKPGPVHVYSIRIQDWAARAPELEETGRWLHHRFAEEGTRLGLLGGGDGPAKERGWTWDALHADMPSHNRYVGATYHLALGGQALKGVNLYNRWALSSHRPTEFLARALPDNRVWFDHTELELLPDGDIRLELETETRSWAA